MVRGAAVNKSKISGKGSQKGSVMGSDGRHSSQEDDGMPLIEWDPNGPIVFKEQKKVLLN